MANPQRFVALLMLFAAVAPQLGCVALNIPSERFGDPGDNGGLFGHWRSGGRSHLQPHDVGADGSSLPGGHCDPHAHPVHDGVMHQGVLIDGGPLEVDPFDPSVDVDGNRKQPEIPWPRFHPVPTRPVFGPATGFAPAGG